MPVPHGYKAVRVDPLPAQFGLQRARLPLRMPPDWRASADGGVVMLHLARARVVEMSLARGFRPMRAKGKSIISGSQKRLYKKGSIASSVSGPPSCKRT